MTREAINLTISEPLRRAQIPQRLDALAQITGLAQAQLAGRALTIGLGYIEADLTLIFPGVAAPSSDNPSPPALSTTPAGAAGHDDAQQGAASPRMDATPAAASTMEPAPAPPPRTEQPAPAPASQAEQPAPALAPAPPSHPEQPAPAPRADRTGRVSTKEAARSLKITTAALQQRIGRSPELRRHSQRVGRAAMWDLTGLRQALAK